MSLLKKIKESDQAMAVSVRPTVVETPSQPEALPADRHSCLCPYFWQSIYSDGIWRCGECEPPPTAALAGRWIEFIGSGESLPWLPFDWSALRRRIAKIGRDTAWAFATKEHRQQLADLRANEPSKPTADSRLADDLAFGHRLVARRVGEAIRDDEGRLVRAATYDGPPLQAICTPGFDDPRSNNWNDAIRLAVRFGPDEAWAILQQRTDRLLPVG